MYKLKLKQTAERDLRRLPTAVLQRINEQILTLRHDPRPSGVKKLQGHQTGWRIRVGDYRMVYQIDDAAQTVTIIRVRHRRDVYR